MARRSDRLLDALIGFGVVPVATLDSTDAAVPVGEALLDGGLGCAEITFRTGAAAHVIAALTAKLPELLVGAGTITDLRLAQTAVDAGAAFLVSPGLDATVVEWCLEHHVPIVPGAMTPTEVMAARSQGLDLLKVFPAEPAGGEALLRSLGPVFPDVRFIPTGGIGQDNLERYLRLSMVAACGGSWIVDRRAVESQDFATIGRLAAEAVRTVARVRGQRE